MRAMEALRRLEARRGWDEAELNDFAIIEQALTESRREVARLRGEIRSWITTYVTGGCGEAELLEALEALTQH